MDLTKLKYFYTVAKYEHVTKASEELHLAQPALTKSMRLLEEDLGVPLFYRSGRNIALTEYGKLLKSRLASVFDTLDSTKEEIDRMKNESKVTVKLNVLAASIVIMEAVIKYKNKYPDVVFNFLQNQESADCDITVSTNFDFGYTEFSETRAVIEENIYLAVPKTSKYADKTEIKLDEVKNEKFVTFAGARTFRAICDGFCAQAGFKPQITFESDAVISIKNIIGASAGIGFWPEWSWGKTKPSGIKLLPITEPVCKREIIVEYNKRPMTNKYSKQFFEFLINYLQK